jgi:predicted dehydrogenase
MKALIIGLGGIGQRHARNLRAILGDRLHLIAYRQRRLTHVVTQTLQAEPEKNVERELGIRAFSDLNAALAERPDVAFICNPSNMHLPVATACAKAGCDLFMEKPLSDSLDGIDALSAAVEENGRIAMVGYQLRFHPAVQKLASVLESGQLGRILAVRACVGEYLPNWHPYEDYRQTYAARAELGGGVVLTLIHEYDYLYSLFGMPARLFACGGHLSHLEINVEDTASILMECSREGRPLPVHLHQDYLQNPPSRQCEVIGDRGKARLDFRSLTLTVYESERPAPEVHEWPDFERNQLFIDQTRHFLDCVVTRTQPIVNLEGGAQSLRMALAAKLSMSTHSLVELPPVELPPVQSPSYAKN